MMVDTSFLTQHRIDMRSNTPICIVYKSAGKTVKTEYYIRGKEVPFHLFKQKIKRLDPPRITIKNIEK